jgi:outer membrane translocation and assembly module TamA
MRPNTIATCAVRSVANARTVRERRRMSLTVIAFMPSKNRAAALARWENLTWALALTFLALVLTACTKIPEGRSSVDDVTVLNAHKVDSSDVEGKLATQPTTKFLYLFRGILYDYELYDPAVVQEDLARVERFYRSRGYYDAHARAGRVIQVSKNHVQVEILVQEGEPVTTGDIEITGLEELPAPIVKAVLDAARKALPFGKPFDEDGYKNAHHDAVKALTDKGYAYAKINRDAFIDLVHHVARVTLDARPGRTARFGPVHIVGLDPDGPGPRPQEIQEKPVRRALTFKEGEPYSTETLEKSTQSLLDLQVFAGVEFVPDLSHPDAEIVPLTLKLEPTRLRQVRLGGGLEFDEIKTELHAITGWEDHNFLGDLRDFRVDFQPGIVFYPLLIDHWVVPNYFFPEEKLRIQFRQPSFIESKTTFFIRPEFNVYPLLVQTNPNPADPVVGYVENKAAIGVDRTFWKLYVNLSYNIQTEIPFSYKDPLDPDLSTLVILYPDLLTQLDFRDDRNHPHKGIFLGNELQWAFGGTAHDVKIQPEIRTYVPVGKRVTFATHATIGLMFPTNYGSIVENHLADNSGPLAERVRDIETVFFRGFFSGGPNSNRGFPIRGVGPYGDVPFLNPVTAAQQVELSCNPTSPSYNPNQCLIPIGGFTLWEFSNEFRIKIKGPISAATFCDMSDVAPQVASIRLRHLHLSCGIGARYDTPVGPIRLDIGYRIQPLQVLGYKNDVAVHQAFPTEGDAPALPRILGVPLAIAIGIGEAY